MPISPQQEHAWNVDEGIRLTEAFIRDQKNSYWKQKILEIEERNLFDYERPLQYIPRTKKPIWSQL